MGKLFVFSIFALEDFEKLGYTWNWAILVIWGKEGQYGNFDIFVLNYDIKELLKQFGCIGNEIT